MGLRDRYIAAMQTRCVVALPRDCNMQHGAKLLRVAPPRELQRATSPPIRATTGATPAQQRHGLPGVETSTHATPHATLAQQGQSGDATSLQHDEQAERESFEERAAIMEFDGGMSRADAEVAAQACVTCEFQSRRKTCLEPVLAGLAPHFSIRFCEQVPDAGAACGAYKGKS